VPVGNQASAAQLNAELAGLITRVRDDLRAVSVLQQQVTAIGAAGLTAAGFTAPDAATYMNALSYLSTVAGVFQGTATQGSIFNFENALAPYAVGQ
jgi:hypothetical protein